MDGTIEARKEYFKFMLLLLFFAAFTAGAAMLRPLLLGEKRLRQATETPVVMAIFTGPTETATPTPAPTSTIASSSEPTSLPSPSPILSITPSPTEAPAVYVVKAGDTLFRIGQEHGVTVDDLARANALLDRDRILVGQELIIPVPGGRSATASAATPVSRGYIVQRGDTLWGIARTFGVELDLLITENDVDDPAWIVAGQVLKIPR